MMTEEEVRQFIEDNASDIKLVLDGFPNNDSLKNIKESIEALNHPKIDTNPNGYTWTNVFGRS